jgi:hypothetical protein
MIPSGNLFNFISLTNSNDKEVDHLKGKRDAVHDRSGLKPQKFLSIVAQIVGIGFISYKIIRGTTGNKGKT